MSDYTGDNVWIPKGESDDITDIDIEENTED
jgi:hypothetical protein